MKKERALDWVVLGCVGFELPCACVFQYGFSLSDCLTVGMLCEASVSSSICERLFLVFLPIAIRDLSNVARQEALSCHLG